jgi:hypothetical protein
MEAFLLILRPIFSWLAGISSRLNTPSARSCQVGGLLVLPVFPPLRFGLVEIFDFALENPDMEILVVTKNPDLAYLLSTLRIKGRTPILFTITGASRHLIGQNNAFVIWEDWYGSNLPTFQDVASSGMPFSKTGFPATDITFERTIRNIECQSCPI